MSQPLFETVRMDKLDPAQWLQPGVYHCDPQFESDGTNAVIALPKSGGVTLEGLTIDASQVIRGGDEDGLRIVRQQAVDPDNGLEEVIIRDCSFRGSPDRAIDMSHTRHAAAPRHLNIERVHVSHSYYGIDVGGCGDVRIADSEVLYLSGPEVRVSGDDAWPQPEASSHAGWAGWNCLSGAPLTMEVVHCRLFGDCHGGAKIGEAKDSDGNFTGVAAEVHFRNCELAAFICSGSHSYFHDCVIDGRLRTWKDHLDSMAPALTLQQEGDVQPLVELHDTTVISQRVNTYNLPYFAHPIDNSQGRYIHPRALQMYGHSQLLLA